MVRLNLSAKRFCRGVSDVVVDLKTQSNGKYSDLPLVYGCRKSYLKKFRMHGIDLYSLYDSRTLPLEEIYATWLERENWPTKVKNYLASVKSFGKGPTTSNSTKFPGNFRKDKGDLKKLLRFLSIWHDWQKILFPEMTENRLAETDSF